MQIDLDRLARANPEFVERLYRQYRRDPRSVDERWALVFAGYEFARTASTAEAAPPPSERETTALLPAARPPLRNPHGVLDLVHSFRAFGRLIADSDPLGRHPRTHPFFDEVLSRFSDEDLEQEVVSPFCGRERARLAELIEALRQTYCGTFSVEFMHLFDKARRDWLLERMEPVCNHPQLAPQVRRRLLKRLIMAADLERFLHAKYRGSKRFSLEGGEALISLLDALVGETASYGIEEIIFGMPHRGRLNVLAHILKKPFATLLAEFEGLQEAEDVKYHLGYTCEHETHEGRRIRLTLSPNPSHLEAVDPVVLGMARARQEQLGDEARQRVIPVLMHGDAAFAGQGIVYETLELSGLAGYTTGGTIHVLINNQVGFTADPSETRSTPYASDLAKTLQAPVFHVNADDPEAAVWAAQLALGFRQTFHSDVFINLVCYRRHGHNELDDPTFTQPVMYRLIRDHPPVDALYAERLVAAGVLRREDVEQMHAQVRERLEAALARARAEGGGPAPARPSANATPPIQPAPASRVSTERLRAIAAALSRVPEGFTPHPRLLKHFERLQELVETGTALPWAAGELLAYGSLLLEGIPVRLSGQDSARGTFSHRHAVWYDAETGSPYVPLNHLAPEQASFEVLNSPLSEEGALGFEYGLSVADPHRLVIWEAQYGDFANVAQVIVDQFIASGQAKWGQASGLVLLLPHGYEGQGPDHSSARLERFLQLCAEGNLRVIYPTTPAQGFHALRRQAHEPHKRPLIVMAPKSLLRHPRAVSSLQEFEGAFQPVLPDRTPSARQVRRVLLCTGKVFYALEEARRERGLEDVVALVRVEELYPWPAEALREALEPYLPRAEVVWVQEEPQNQGAWSFVAPRLEALLGRKARYVGRPEAASPATGQYRAHLEEERALIETAFDLQVPTTVGTGRDEEDA